MLNYMASLDWFSSCLVGAVPKQKLTELTPPPHTPAAALCRVSQGPYGDAESTAVPSWI